MYYLTNADHAILGSVYLCIIYNNSDQARLGAVCVSVIYIVDDKECRVQHLNVLSIPLVTKLQM